MQMGQTPMGSPEMRSTRRVWWWRWWFWVFVIISIVAAALVIAFGVRVYEISHEPDFALQMSRANAPTSKGQSTGVVYPESARAPQVGASTALVTIVEFSDFECPYCAQAYPVVKSLMQKYGDKGVQLQYRHFPIDGLHVHARQAAAASVCAQAQGAFWKYHDLLFANQQRLATDDLTSYAQSLGLNMTNFTNCLNAPETQAIVERDEQDGIALGVGGTPTFFVNGQELPGAVPFELFDGLIAKLLNQYAQ